MPAIEDDRTGVNFAALTCRTSAFPGATWPMLSRYRTALIFWAAVFLSLASIASAFVLDAIAWVLIIPSILFNLWSVRRSDRGGFVKSRQLRRAHEPARRFNGLQTFTLIVIVMCQVGIGTFLLLR